MNKMLKEFIVGFLVIAVIGSIAFGFLWGIAFLPVWASVTPVLIFFSWFIGWAMLQ